MNGEHLRKRLNNQPMSLADIARKLNISPQSLENRLRTKEVKISFIVDLSRVTNTSVYFFLKNSDIEDDFNPKHFIDNKKDDLTTKDDIVLKEIIAIKDKLEYIDCFIDAVKMKFEIDKELNSALSNLKKTQQKDF